jgi:hypothetical protein
VNLFARSVVRGFLRGGESVRPPAFCFTSRHFQKLVIARSEATKQSSFRASRSGLLRLRSQ